MSLSGKKKQCIDCGGEIGHFDYCKLDPPITPEADKKHQRHCRASLGFVCSCLPDPEWPPKNRPEADSFDPAQDKWEKEFDEKYYDFNTPSGLNQRNYRNFKAMVDDIKQFIAKQKVEAKKEGYKETRRISDAAIKRMQIIAVELAGRQKDDEANKIANDIRGNYEDLLEKLEEDL